jgi:hypothetical protein
MTTKTGYKEGTHQLRPIRGGQNILVDIVQMPNGDWKWYSEEKGFSKGYGASDIALAMACQTLKAKPTR